MADSFPYEIDWCRAIRLSHVTFKRAALSTKGSAHNRRVALRGLSRRVLSGSNASTLARAGMFARPPAYDWRHRNADATREPLFALIDAWL
jgi:hypothetical protein